MNTSQVAAATPIQLFRTMPAPCPYLPRRVERRLIVDLSGQEAAHCFDSLSRAGFRRSHHYAYRPACADCTRCVAVRVRAAEFNPSRTMRRIARANSGLVGRVQPPRATEEQFALFQHYQRTRHGDGDMASMTAQDYRAMVNETPVDTIVIEYRGDGERLVAACLIDCLGDGLSAVYSFYDPKRPELSLGTFMILDLIARARAVGLSHVYLGYWIAESRKMSYKAKFQPLEGLGPEGWSELRPRPAHTQGQVSPGDDFANTVFPNFPPQSMT